MNTYQIDVKAGEKGAFIYALQLKAKRTGKAIRAAQKLYPSKILRARLVKTSVT